MSDYLPGSLQKTILGSKSSEINSDLDALFKNSAGPAKTLEKSTTNYVENKVKNPSVDDNESTLCKNEHSWKDSVHNCHVSSAHKETSKTLEEKYEIKKVSSETNEETNFNCEKKLKRKRSAKDSKSQKRTKVTGDTDNKKNIELDEVANIHAETEILTKSSIDSKTMNVDDNDQCKNDDLERLQRTVFIGNLSVSVIQKTNHKKLKVLFSRFGKIESIRFRSIAFSELLPRKLAFVTGKLHPERDILNAYIVFKEPSSVQKAITMNAQMFLGKHLRVDSVVNPQSHDRRRTVFIGSLPFDAQEEELWLHFENCGEVENVRIVRDSKTNVGKGFAYVQFKERASVELALKLSNTKIGIRKIRVMRCTKENHASKLNSYKPAKDRPKIGKVKFGKELIEGTRAISKVSSRRPEKGKSVQKRKLVKQTFDGTRTTKSKEVRLRTQAWKKVQKKKK